MKIAFLNTESNKYLTIHELNELICTLWDEEPNQGLVCPTTVTPDWYTVISLTIHCSQDSNNKDLLKTIMKRVLSTIFQIDSSDEDLYNRYGRPYLDLLDYFDKLNIKIVEID